MKQKTNRITRIIAVILMVFVISSIYTPSFAATTLKPISKTITVVLDSTKTKLTIQGSGAIPPNTFSSTGAYKDYVGKIETIVVKGSITEIDRGAFTGCTKLKSLTLNEGLKTIYVGAFTNSKYLKAVTIPKSVTFVQNGAFNTKTKITCKNTSLKKYSKNGYTCEDTLKFNAIRDFISAYKLFEQINVLRQKDKKAKLYMDLDLQKYAMDRAAELVVLFSHTRPNGERYYSISENVLAEVIDAGGKDPKVVATTSIKNAENKKTMLNKDYKYVGVGCVQYNGINYWVQLYSKGKVSSKTYTNPNTSKTFGFTVNLPKGTNTIKLAYAAITNISQKVRSSKVNTQIKNAGSSFTYTFGINTGNIKLMVGETANAVLASGTTASGKVSYAQTTGKWKSDNKKIATVSKKGVITAVAPGTTKIQAGSISTLRTSITVTVLNIMRLYGSDRYLTAYKIASRFKQELGGGKLGAIIIATGRNYPDALSGGYLGKVKKAPIILVNADNPATITTAIKYVKSNVKVGGKVYLLGGAAVVPDSLKNSLKSSYQVKRLGGSNRYDTNVQILKEAGVKNTEMVVTTGQDFRNPLIASSTGYPLLVMKEGTLAPSQQSFLTGRGIKKFTIIGDYKSVPSTANSILKRYSKNVARITGSNAFDISQKVAEKFNPSPKGIAVAIENNYPDALTGGPLAIITKSPLFLIDNSHYTYARNYVKKKKITKEYVLGGAALISDKTAKLLLS